MVLGHLNGVVLSNMIVNQLGPSVNSIFVKATYKRAGRRGFLGKNEVQRRQDLFPTGELVELEWLQVDAHDPRLHVREHVQEMEHFLRARLSRRISVVILDASMNVSLYLQSNTALLLVEALRFVDDAEGDSTLREGEGK